jgi:hypothetical protein
MKNHNVKYLVYKLLEAGLITATTYLGAKQVLHYWIRTGKLKLRRRSYNGYYMVTDEEINAILDAFSESGPGFWYATPSKPNGLKPN